MTTWRLTFYLLRDGITDFNDALEPEKEATAVSVDPLSGIDGMFLYVSPRPSTPKWMSFVQPLLADQLPDLRSSSTSALLLLRSRKRMFALTFGYGRSLLDLSKIEFQFGLRVALNRVDPRQLRSLDTKTFEDLVVSTNTQVSKSAELPTFRVDVATDILRAVTGEPRDESLAKRSAGSDSLTPNVELAPNDLPELCGRLLDAFTADDYKAEFGWIDQLTQVRDVARVEELNELLVQQLVTGTVGTTHLAMPEGIDWQDVESFKIGGAGRATFDELDLEEYLDRLGADRGELTLDLLKSRRVSVGFSRSGSFDARWSLYQCLVSEQRVNDVLHVLIEGRWFAVSESLVDEVDEFLTTIPDSEVPFVPAEPGETEGAYNERLTHSAPGQYFKFDGRIARAAGASSAIEFCDVLTSSGEFVHVKRKARSSTLSHLFAQGTVSATTFFADATFRERLREHIEQHAKSEHQEQWLDLVPGAGELVDKSRYRVTYAVVTNTGKAGRDWLPFFSKLNLMQQGRQLLNTGYKIALARVPIADPP